MQDIRKPFTRSSSNRNLNARVEQFENGGYERDGYSDRDSGPVRIPVTRVRRNVNDMDMYPRRRRDDFYEEDRQEYEDDRERRPHTFSRNSQDRDEDNRGRRKESSLGTWIFIITVILLAVGAGLLTYVFNSATVTIVPKYKDVDVNKTIVFSQKSTSTSEVPFIVETLTSTKSKKLSLSESKKVESKASGKVIIYNNYDATPQKLIKNTRLQATSGKIYRISQSITVPGKKGDTPGAVEVVVFADSNGGGYNAASAEFSIPGFKGTPREKAFYGKTKSSLSGGSSGNVSLASLSDLNAAKDALALELAQEIKTGLMKINKEGYIGLYSASDITYSDNEAAILSGTADTYEVTATGYLMLADEAKLAQLIATTVRDYANDPVRLGYEETLAFTRKDTDHIASSTSLSILTQGKPRVIWVSDTDAIKEAVQGKKRDDFKPIMKGLTSIIGAEISFSPLWLSSFPTTMSKISIIESLPKR